MPQRIARSARLRRPALAVAVAALLAGAGAPAVAQPFGAGGGRPVPAVDGDAGAYLAAREAWASGDLVALLPFLDRLLRLDPDNTGIRINLLTAQMALGDLEAAAAEAERVLAAMPGYPPAVMALTARAFARRDYAAVPALDDSGARGDSLDAAIARAWAFFGLGRVGEAFAALETDTGGAAARPVLQAHLALMRALAGDVEGALDLFEAPAAQPISELNRRTRLAHIQLLGLAERFDEAIGLIDASFADRSDPAIRALRAAYAERRSLPFSVIAEAAEGMAEFYALAAPSYRAGGSSNDALAFAQAALAINPRLSEARILIGQIWEERGQHALAAAAYTAVPPDDAFALVAAAGLAQTLEAQGDAEGAIAVLAAAEARLPESALAPQLLADALRRAGRHDEAIAASTRAIDLMTARGEAIDWRVWFSRAVAFERSGRWPEAEADFRAALAVEPDQPTVLNYLGYSLVERRENLDEALEMIERAVAGEPDSGYIVDSLAWALFRLGRYDEALPHMERAVALLPADPILNDHLGDIYWAVGRKREAEFQWRRALSFGPHEDLDMDRVRRKLEIGLDRVLAEEGAPPLHPSPAAAP